MKTIRVIVIMLLSVPVLHAQDADSTRLFIEKIESSLQYQTGKITLKGDVGELNVPKGYRYLDPRQSMYVLSDLYGNPKDSAVLGLLVPEGLGVLSDGVYLFEISYEAIGYVKDDDADDIDYDDLLEEQQKEMKEANPQRVKDGYPSIEFIGWASKPYYDKEKKVLHWAKELKFGDNEIHTLNYNLRILGRKGVFVLNAIASMSELEAVKSNVDAVIGCITYTEGNKYADYVPDVDEVAAWTIGGLVAGKVLAKVGFFALLLKFWKFIALGVVGIFAGIRKWWANRNGDGRIIVAPQSDTTIQALPEPPATEKNEQPPLT